MTATTYKARVWERGTVSGTGTVTLPGVAQVGGFQTFASALATGSQVAYGIFDATNGAWEVGMGVFTASSNTLTRATVLESSNAGSLVSFAGAICDIQVVSPSPVQTSAGAGSQGLPVALNALGQVDSSMLPAPTNAQLTAIVAALPTTLPGSSGVLWLNAGVLQLS